jgi:hypothetical protein
MVLCAAGVLSASSFTIADRSTPTAFEGGGGSPEPPSDAAADAAAATASRKAAVAEEKPDRGREAPKAPGAPEGAR